MSDALHSIIMSNVITTNYKNIDCICNIRYDNHCAWSISRAFTEIKSKTIIYFHGLLSSNSTAGLPEKQKRFYVKIIIKIVNYVLKFSVVLSLKRSEAVNTPCWSYICSFQENRHGFNN